jgi:NTE family protein
MTDSERTSIAIACQGGGSHTAFTAGVLTGVLRDLPEEYEINALSGTSGGAMCAALAWDGLRRGDVAGALDRLEGFWDAIGATSPVDRFTNDWALWTSRLTNEFGSFGLSPYYHTTSVAAQRHLEATIERFVTFDDDASTAPPNLFVGAVDTGSGTFEVFRDGEGGTAALLASAAVPTLFRAVEIGESRYWDGLFSQNPPIRHFVTEAEEKPDEIWIIRINPLATDRALRSLDDIADRRNELAGNLSLEQEKHMIEAINDLIEEGVITDGRFKHIALPEVCLDMELDLESKLDRDPTFLRELWERGEANASRFWTET